MCSCAENVTREAGSVKLRRARDTKIGMELRRTRGKKVGNVKLRRTRGKTVGATTQLLRRIIARFLFFICHNVMF
jgi:hypothetical protein